MDQDISGTSFAELVMYIEETIMDEDTAPVFRLSDLAHLYKSRMEQLGVNLGSRVQTTRLKERLLAEFPDLRAPRKGREVLLVFDDDIGSALVKACEFDSDKDALQLARAANIVQREMFGEPKSFAGFPNGCQESSVTSPLLTLVNMILQGPNIKDQMEEATPTALTIAQSSSIVSNTNVQVGKKW